MANIFSGYGTRAGSTPPPYTPYVVAEPMAIQPHVPTDETHSRALDKWRIGQKRYRAHAGFQGVSCGKYAFRRLRFILAADLSGAWPDFGGLAGHINQIDVIIEMSITDRAVISITYDFRIRKEIGEIAPKRSPGADYIDFLSNVNSDIRAGEIREFESNATAVKSEKGRERLAKEKEEKVSRKREGREGEVDSAKQALAQGGLGGLASENGSREGECKSGYGNVRIAEEEGGEGGR